MLTCDITNLLDSMPEGASYNQEKKETFVVLSLKHTPPFGLYLEKILSVS